MFSFGEICMVNLIENPWKTKKKLVWFKLKIKYHYTAFIYTYLGWVCKWNLRINHKSFNWQLNAFHLYYKKTLTKQTHFYWKRQKRDVGSLMFWTQLKEPTNTNTDTHEYGQKQTTTVLGKASKKTLSDEKLMCNNNFVHHFYFQSKCLSTKLVESSM